MSTTTLCCPACMRDVPAGSMFCPWDGSPLDRVTPSGRRVDPLLQAQVGEYVIQERIGAGGMGIVYRAVQPLIGKQVAIKVLREEFAESEDQVQRLLVEARAVNAIGHRGIIDIFGFGKLQDGRPYVVMELLQGLSLDAFIRQQGRLEVAATVQILDEMLSALGAAHRQGIIHRDLKPGNVFLMDDPDGGRSVKLLDFGIAKLTEGHLEGPKTLGGIIMGTPSFMAPEQVQGKPVSSRTDLYAVGMIAFQMLTGRLAYEGEPTQVLLMQVSEPPPTPSSLVPDLPPEVDALVLRLLDKEAGQRPGSVDEVRQALQQLLQGPSSAPRTQVLPPPEPTPAAPPTSTARMGVPEAAAAPAAKTAPATGFPWKWVGAGAAVALLAVGGAVVAGKEPAGLQAPGPSPLAGKGLAALRTQTEAARTLSERKALVVAMDIWERDFLRR